MGGLLRTVALAWEMRDVEVQCICADRHQAEAHHRRRDKGDPAYGSERAVVRHSARIPMADCSLLRFLRRAAHRILDMNGNESWSPARRNGAESTGPPAASAPAPVRLFLGLWRGAALKRTRQANPDPSAEPELLAVHRNPDRADPGAHLRLQHNPSRRKTAEKGAGRTAFQSLENRNSSRRGRPQRGEGAVRCAAHSMSGPVAHRTAASISTSPWFPRWKKERISLSAGAALPSVHLRRPSQA